MEDNPIITMYEMYKKDDAKYMAGARDIVAFTHGVCAGLALMDIDYSAVEVNDVKTGVTHTLEDCVAEVLGTRMLDS